MRPKSRIVSIEIWSCGVPGCRKEHECEDTAQACIDRYQRRQAALKHRREFYARHVIHGESVDQIALSNGWLKRHVANAIRKQQREIQNIMPMAQRRWQELFAWTKGNAPLRREWLWRNRSNPYRMELYEKEFPPITDCTVPINQMRDVVGVIVERLNAH